MAGHQQFHEGLGGLVARFAFHDNFLDLAIIDVADGALDQVRIRMNHAGRSRAERAFAYLVPQTGKIIEVALDLCLGTRKARGAHDQTHRARQTEIADDRLQALAIPAIGNLARYAATVAGIGHEHAIAARQRQICRKSSTLVAALFLGDLHQQHLATLNYILDLVAATQGLALCARLVDFLGAAAAATVLRATPLGRTAPTTAPTLVAAIAALIVIVVVAVVRILVLVLIGRIVFAVLNVTILDGGDVILLAGVDFLETAFILVFLVILIVGRNTVFVILLGAKLGFFLCCGLFFGQQRFPVLRRYLVIVGMDFAEGQEAVAIATEIHERRLQRRFYPGDFREVYVALYLLVFGRFEIELLNSVSLEHRHPCFFRVARIDKHARCHVLFSGQSPLRLPDGVKPNRGEGIADMCEPRQNCGERKSSPCRSGGLPGGEHGCETCLSRRKGAGFASALEALKPECDRSVASWLAGFYFASRHQPVSIAGRSE